MIRSTVLPIERTEDYIHADPILKSPSFSAPEEFNDAKIGLKVMKENSTNSGTLKYRLFNG